MSPLLTLLQLQILCVHNSARRPRFIGMVSSPPHLTFKMCPLIHSFNVFTDGCRPWYDGQTEPCVNDHGKNPASCWTNESKVPASVDWVSCDSYQDPTVSKSAWPWDPSSEVPEATAKRYFAEHFIYPKLHPHQKLITLPGLFGNRSDTWTDEFLVSKMHGYWAWAKADTRVAGFCA
eukprot:SAG22_NODE_8268_length_669_cov_0.838596_1_plen_176_part_01